MRSIGIVAGLARPQRFLCGVVRKQEAEGLEPPTLSGSRIPSEFLIQPGCFQISHSRASALSVSEGRFRRRRRPSLRICGQKHSVEGARTPNLRVEGPVP